MGPEGIYQVGYQAIQKAIYMKSQLIEKGFNVTNDKSSLREFIVETTLPAKKIISEMGNRGFLAGIEYSENLLLVALTEKRTKDEIDNYVQQFSEVNHG
jgi:glycine dehydrogenase subunit 1